MGNPNQNAQQPQRADITSNLVGLEPFGAIFNLYNNDINEFLNYYFRKTHNISELYATRTLVIRDGATRPELAVYALFDTDGKSISSDLSHFPKELRSQVDLGNIRPSRELQNALRPLVGNDIKLRQQSAKGQKPLAAARLDVFRVIGMMLDADPRKHDLRVLEIGGQKKKNNFIISVLKTLKYTAPGIRGGEDEIDEMLYNMERQGGNRRDRN